MHGGGFWFLSCVLGISSFSPLGSQSHEPRMGTYPQDAGLSYHSPNKNSPLECLSFRMDSFNKNNSKVRGSVKGRNYLPYLKENRF